jgi:hypothetical protein
MCLISSRCSVAGNSGQAEAAVHNLSEGVLPTLSPYAQHDDGDADPRKDYATASSGRRRAQNTNRQQPVLSNSPGARGERGGRCRHDLSAALCAYCAPRVVISRPERHVPATVTLVCQECHRELTSADANLTSLASSLMWIRREHSHREHSDLFDAFARAVVVIRCEACAVGVDTLDLNIQSLANELMAATGPRLPISARCPSTMRSSRLSPDLGPPNDCVSESSPQAGWWPSINATGHQLPLAGGLIWRTRCDRI